MGERTAVERRSAERSPRRAEERPAAALGRLDPAGLLALVAGARAGAAGAEAREALRGGGLARLSRVGPEVLRAELGLGAAPARRLAAAFELGRRVERERADPGEALHSPQAVYRLMCPDLRGLERESFHALLLDGKHRLRARERISEGTLTTSLVHPREVFRTALRVAAAALVVVHNHPSGDPEPSREDLEVTRRLLEAGRLLGVPLLDHVIVGAGRYVSLRERMAF